MGDIKLFRIVGAVVSELEGKSVAVEKSLQTLIERQLESFLGIRLVKSEHSTGAVHGGRIDTLGLDENHCPVIIEFKRATNENVINQGLYYLDWLLDHRGDFYKLVLEKLGKGPADSIDWSGPRLVCIAGDFTKYDELAVKQIPRNIELFRYKRYGEEFLLLELVNSTSVEATASDAAPAASKARGGDKTFAQQLAASPPALVDRYEALKAFLTSLGDDVILKELKLNVAFRRIRNFACVELHPASKSMKVYLRLNPDEVSLRNGFTRDMRGVGHWGTGDLEVTIASSEEFEEAKPLFLRSYEAA